MSDVHPVIYLIVTAIVSVLAASGFWAIMLRIIDRNSASQKLLLGLAHDRIVTLGMRFIERGWITKDEYDDYVRYLYTPYAVFGGNGLADKVMDGVSKLQIYSMPPTDRHMEYPNEQRISTKPLDVRRSVPPKSPTSQPTPSRFE